MIITGDWVLPVSGPPVRHGAVVVKGREIAAVGPVDQIVARYPALPISDHPGCIISPGLVNACTRLSLGALAGLMPGMRFAERLARLAAITRLLEHDDFVASASFGALECLKTGCTVVGDACYGPESVSAAGDMGVGGVFFWEVLGMRDYEMGYALERAEFPGEDGECGGRQQCGISPHAPYASGPDLLKEARRYAKERGVGYLIHLAESPEERQLLVQGDGPLRPVATRLAHRFTPPETGPVEYAHRLGILDGAIAAHCVDVTEDEARSLAARAQGVVLCPLSSRHLGNGEPPVATLRSSGVRLAVGTGSFGGNPGVDLFAEGRALMRLDPELTCTRVLDMLTIEGARILGVEELFGSLDAGKQADLVVTAAGVTEYPIEHLIGEARPGHIRAVMSAGTWRILDGSPAMSAGKVQSAARKVRAKATAMLARSPETDRWPAPQS